MIVPDLNGCSWVLKKAAGFEQSLKIFGVNAFKKDYFRIPPKMPPFSLLGNLLHTWPWAALIPFYAVLYSTPAPDLPENFSQIAARPPGSSLGG
jgi:hypothetical protein